LRAHFCGRENPAQYDNFFALTVALKTLFFADQKRGLTRWIF
jgi:hypothetical protein